MSYSMSKHKTRSLRYDWFSDAQKKSRWRTYGEHGMKWAPPTSNSDHTYWLTEWDLVAKKNAFRPHLPSASILRRWTTKVWNYTCQLKGGIKYFSAVLPWKIGQFQVQAVVWFSVWKLYRNRMFSRCFFLIKKEQKEPFASFDVGQN